MAAPLLTPGKLGKLKTRKASEESSLPSICIYGGPGTGKTTLGASACEVEAMSPVLSLNIENGTQSISTLYPDVEVFDVTTFKALQSAYDELYDNSDFEAKTCAGFKTVLVDNLTEGQKKGMEHIFADDNTGRMKSSFTDFVMGSWSDGSYNKNSEQMRKLIRAFRELPCYVIMVAWEKDLNKDEKKHLWSPAFSKTFAEEAPGMMNDVYRYSFDTEGQRSLQTNRTKDVVAKDRTRLLPTHIQNPSMKLLHDYWTGALVKPDEATQTTTRSTLRKKI